MMEDELKMLHMEKTSSVPCNENDSENLTQDSERLPTDNTEDPPPPPYTESPNESPPSYDSILGFLKAAKTSSMSRKEVLAQFLILIFESAICTFTLAILLTVPISMIIIGIMYIHDCPLEICIPIYLIVTGIIVFYFLVRGLYGKIVKWKEVEEKETILGKIFSLLGTCFFIAWFVAGNIWIFDNTSAWSLYKGSPNYCHPILYEFALGILISFYIMFCIALTCFICLVA